MERNFTLELIKIVRSTTKRYIAIIFLLSLSMSAQVTDKRISKKSLSENGQPNLIVFSNKSSYRTTDSQKVFQEQLGMNDNQSFKKTKTDSDKEGFVHERFQLYKQGIKVEFANYILHSKNGKLVSMNGEYYNLDNITTKLVLTAQEAFGMAINHIGAQKYLWETPDEAKAIGYEKPQGELVFLPIMGGEQSKLKNKVRLAYKFDIYAKLPLSRGDLYIDALTGEALFYNATIKHLGKNAHGAAKNANKTDQQKETDSNVAYVSGNAATRYSGEQAIQTTLTGGGYILLDETRGQGIQTYNCEQTAEYLTTNFTDADNNWTTAEYDNSNKDNGALDAHWGAEMTYDYFSKIHKRNSFDDKGEKIKSFVHFNLIEAGQSNNNNAFWNGSVMTYGDGSGAGGLDMLTSLDVASHEIGHAVCQHTANLAYRYESGAMNEGFSDIWAACVEHYAAPSKSIWTIGEDIDLRGRNGIRSMSDPKSERQPDTYRGAYWVNDMYCLANNTNDYCGVHTNSGVLNHWFYILSVGKKGTNDIGNSYDVTGITIDKAAKIAYRLESTYLTENSTYADARTFAIQAATDLYGDASPEVIATTNAFYAVGVGALYGTIPPEAPTNLVASAITTTGTTLSWTAPVDNGIAVTGYDIYQDSFFIGASTTTTYTVAGLGNYRTYSFYVVAKGNSGTASAESNKVDIRTLPEYCKSESSTARNSDVIAKVAIGTISNVSTKITGYEDFLSISTDMMREAEYSITITPSEVTRLPGGYGYAVFIDYGQNGLYQPVWTKEPTTDAVVTGKFIIPKSAKLGATRMRVVMEYAEIPNDCGTFDGGQVEDYSVNIINAPGMPSQDYCDSSGTTSDEYISKVELGTISNESKSSWGYEDFTLLSTDLSIGNNYTISITPAWPYFIAEEAYSVFIDYNQNGDFSDPGETVWTKGASTTSPVTGTFTIPATATLGSTRMRVSMRYEDIPGPCDDFKYGEVEDYTINIVSTLANPDLDKPDLFSDLVLYPNPVDDELHISLPESTGFVYKIINTLGQQVDSGHLSGGSVNVSQLSSGVYNIELSNGEKRGSKKFVKK